MKGNVSFEQALEKLEGIVEDLENGDVALEESLKKYEEGVKLARTCQDKLAQAEQKIEILMKDKSGELTKAPFNTEEVEEEEPAAKKKAVSKKKISDEDLLI